MRGHRYLLVTRVLEPFIKGPEPLAIARDRGDEGGAERQDHAVDAHHGPRRIDAVRRRGQGHVCRRPGRGCPRRDHDPGNLFQVSRAAAPEAMVRRRRRRSRRHPPHPVRAVAAADDSSGRARGGSRRKNRRSAESRSARSGPTRPRSRCPLRPRGRITNRVRRIQVADQGDAASTQAEPPRPRPRPGP